MRSRPATRRTILVPALGLALAATATATITACSSGSSPSSSPAATSAPATTSAPAASPTAAASGNATATVKANWEKFFAGTTSTATRVTMMENGQKFSSAMGALSVMGSASSVKVTSVKLKSPTVASVKYTIYLGGQPMLSNVDGTAVYSHGKWLVSDTSVCQLLTLQNAGKAPSVCTSAS